MLAADLRWTLAPIDDPVGWQSHLQEQPARIEKATGAARQELRRLQLEPKALSSGCFEDLVCEAVAARSRLLENAAPSDIAVARPAAARQLELVDGQLLAFYLEPNLTASERLLMIAARDQFLRRTLDYWEYASEPSLTRNLVLLGLTLRTVSFDLQSQQEFIAIAGSQPSLSDPRLSPAAQEAAWLIVQHADRRPYLQASVLHHTTRPTAGSELDKNLAYLEDRVGLWLHGTQIYGTQFGCENGKIVPIHLAPGDVDQRRRSRGLTSLAEYLKMAGGVC